MKQLSMTIEMKATEQFFPVVLLYIAVQGSSNCWFSMKSLSVVFLLKATEQ